MNKRVLSVGLVVLGLVCGEAGKAQSAIVVIGVDKEKLPGARIEVTGIGYPPKKNISDTQKRLLAERAAIIDGYRVMAATLRGVSGYVVDGSGYIQTSGYIRGAEILDKRYFINGKVEVDLALPVNFLIKGVNEKVNWDSIIRDISRRGYPVYYKEKQTKQITEEEWLQKWRWL